MTLKKDLTNWGSELGHCLLGMQNVDASPSAESPDAMAGEGACADSWTDCCEYKVLPALCVAV